MGCLEPLPFDFVEQEYYVVQAKVAVMAAVWGNRVHEEERRLAHLSPEMQREVG